MSVFGPVTSTHKPIELCSYFLPLQDCAPDCNPSIRNKPVARAMGSGGIAPAANRDISTPSQDGDQGDDLPLAHILDMYSPHFVVRFMMANDVECRTDPRKMV